MDLEAATWTVPDGDSSRHLSLPDLEGRLLELGPAPKDQGRVVALFTRPGSNQRTTLDRAKLTKAEGMPGDRWSQNDSPKPEQQLATMQADVAETIANGQPIGLFGDNLFFDLDLSESNLPVGTQLRAGEALLEVSPEPHDGCLKFKARFGQDALRLVSRKQGRGRNLRGIYLTVVEDGELAAGDPIEVLRQV